MSGKRPSVVLDDNALNIFTDGSSFSGPRQGGAGFVVVTNDADGHEVVDEYPLFGHEGGTNQQMELVAPIEALKFVVSRRSPYDVQKYTKVVIHTDSEYVANNYYSAVQIWPAKGWMTRDDNPVKNARLWKDLVKAASKVPMKVEFQWHKGHSASNPHNKTADKLARKSAKGPLQEPLSITRVRRKTTANTTEAGSIVPAGQRLSIRVVSEEWLGVQRMHLYKCQVVSIDSPYFDKVDDLFAAREIMLKAGHNYDVRLNDEPKRPRIEQVYGEVISEAS